MARRAVGRLGTPGCWREKFPQHFVFGMGKRCRPAKRCIERTVLGPEVAAVGVSLHRSFIAASRCSSEGTGNDSPLVQ